jgi:branched-subunit amino acid ABC-type transport system permease component
MEPEPRDHLPLTAKFHWSWVILLCSLTSGAALILLGLYLSYWVWERRKTGIALFLYLLITVSLAVSLIPNRFFPMSIPWEDIGTFVAVVWIAAGFVLRREIKRYLRDTEGFDPEIKLLWTSLFSVFYINYCLSVLREGSPTQIGGILP